MQKILKDEIRYNYRQIKYRIYIIFRLLLRYFSKKFRTPDVSCSEYDNYWETFWEKEDIFRTDLPFTQNDIVVDDMTPFDYKKNVIIKILSDKISKYNFKTILEVGSGAGLNLLFLAPLFPEVNFYGLEPTQSGVKLSRDFLLSPPMEFNEAYDLGNIENVEIIKGSILDGDLIVNLKELNFDFIFTCAVLEQLYNYLDVVFPNILALSDGYFLFFEEWLEGNYNINNYKTLVDSDYFRASWNYLNQYKQIETLERTIPSLQPSWLKYSVVFIKKRAVEFG